MESPRAQHLQTYFPVPFSIDREAVAADHPDLFAKHPLWFAGVDDWVKQDGRSTRIQSNLGSWHIHGSASSKNAVSGNQRDSRSGRERCSRARILAG